LQRQPPCWRRAAPKDAAALQVRATIPQDLVSLWLELRDVYWSKEGRLSFDAVAVVGALFLGGYALSEFGGAIIHDVHTRATTGVYPPHHVELADGLSPEREGGAVLKHPELQQQKG
jgi:hypothetical protein